jgi:hypothetical protein
VIDPRLLRGGFRIGVFIFVLAAVTLPFQPRDSAEFVVTVMSAVIGGSFVVGIVALTRWGERPIPNDKRGQKEYNVRSTRRGP